MPVYHNHTDTELLVLLKQGNEAAYTEIYNRFYQVLYVHARRRLKDREEVRDVLQDTFTALWNQRESLNPEGNLSAYLYKTVRNRIIDIISRKEVQSRYIVSFYRFLEKSQCITDHSVREKLLTGLIEQEIDALPPKMREVFQLSRKANLSHKEIADALNISEQTVRAHVKNALRILRPRLRLLICLLVICLKFFGRP